MASRAKTFPGRPTNSSSTLPRAAHLDSGVVGRHQCITSHSGSAPASPDMKLTRNSSASEIILRRLW